MKEYLSVAKSLDRNIGQKLGYLDKSGLSKNTVVIYVSGQGFYMGEHGWFDKRFMYEESLTTPFVMRYPGVITPGTTITQFASNLDWAPTILSIAGAKVPADMQGRSLLPVLNSKGKNVRGETRYTITIMNTLNLTMYLLILVSELKNTSLSVFTEKIRPGSYSIFRKILTN